MTLNDFLKRVDIEKDGDKMLILSDGIGWSNVLMSNEENQITIFPDRCNSPFSSDN